MPNRCTCRRTGPVLSCPHCRYLLSLEARALATVTPTRPAPPASVAYASPYVDRKPWEPHVVVQDCYVDNGVTVVFIDRLRTQTEDNTGGHWRGKAQRALEQRSMVFFILRAQLGNRGPLALPLTVTLTRIAPYALDDDNNVSAMKHCRDGIADYLVGEYGKGNDRQDGLEWRYAQRRGAPKQYAVEIRLGQTP